jgi:hypothetical protein
VTGQVKEKASVNYGTDWNHYLLEDGRWSYQACHAILLQEIRDELKRLNAMLGCRNFQDVPRRLSQIVFNTTKPKRERVRKKP